MSDPLPFPMQTFAGPRSYTPMGSHAYALSGNPLTMNDCHRRYQVFNQYLADPQVLTHYKPEATAPGLATLSCQQVIALLLHVPGAPQRQAILRAICLEFGLGPVEDSPWQIWGYYLPGQGTLPVHVYASSEGWLYDTLPGLPVHRTRDQQGLNPPAWCRQHALSQLNSQQVFSVPVHAFAAGTLASIHSPSQAWTPL